MSILFGIKHMKINTIRTDREKYLQITTNLADFPKTLYSLGKLPNDRVPTVAIVGSRKPTKYGIEVTHQLAYELAKRGVVIISGLAFGVDSIAHRAALEAGGTTIAVLGGGVDTSVIYPRSHLGLAKQIVQQGGAVISQYEPTSSPLNWQFLERNRLIAAVADIVIVTEAAKRSGSLSTATHALNLGVELGVVPGSIYSPLSAGTNALIKQGAQVITSVQDVLDIIMPVEKAQTSLILGQTTEENAILQLIQAGERDGEIIQTKSGLETSKFLETITMLEINGLIRSLGGNQWTIR